nr:MAG: DNA pilot protein [Microvirus sp.]
MGLLSSLSPLIGAGAGYFLGPAGGLAAGAGIGSAIGGLLGQDEANSSNAQQAQINRDFQERMSSTSYQRGVEDMKKAGLNPMLAYSQGGASTPGGSVSSPMINKVGAGVSSGQQAMSTMSQLQMNQAQIESVRAATDKVRAETLDQKIYNAKALAEIDRLDSETDLAVSRRPGVRFDNQRKREQVTGAELANMAHRLKLDLDTRSFSADVAKRKAESTLSELDIPAAKAAAKIYSPEAMGDAPAYIKHLLPLLQFGASFSRRR